MEIQDGAIVRLVLAVQNANDLKAEISRLRLDLEKQMLLLHEILRPMLGVDPATLADSTLVQRAHEILGAHYLKIAPQFAGPL